MLGQLELKYCAYYWMCIRQSRPDTYRFACGPPCSVWCGGLSRSGRIYTPPPTWLCTRPMQCDIIGHEGGPSLPMLCRAHASTAASGCDLQRRRAVSTSRGQSAAKNRSMAMSVVRRSRRSGRAGGGRTKIALHVLKSACQKTERCRSGKECDIVSNPAVAIQRHVVVLVLLFG